MSVSPQTVEQSQDNTDTIDRAKSRLKEDTIMDSRNGEVEAGEGNEDDGQPENNPVSHDDDVAQPTSDDGENSDMALSNNVDMTVEEVKAEKPAVDSQNESSPGSEQQVPETPALDEGPEQKPINEENQTETPKSENVPNSEEIEDKKKPDDSSSSEVLPAAAEKPEESASPPETSTSGPTDEQPVSPPPVKASSSDEAKGSATAPVVETDTSLEGAVASCSSASTPSNDKARTQSVYHIKWIKFKATNVAIITQNENGPCPLLAIMNFLLLKGKIKIPGMIEMVTSDQLMEYLGDCIFENAPKSITEDAQLNYEQNMHDAMAVFHKLQTGLDVNVRFTGVNDFEYTSECIVFDLLNIPLYHGWLTDPESPETVAAIGSCSYNQLVEKIISQKNSKKEELMTEALICEEFLQRTASQLTYHGLSELVTSVKEDELCVFFRNNHFSTLYKHKNELFLLVTDQGFLTESNVVWETLCNVEGDGHFVDADFHTYRKPETSTVPIVAPAVPVGSDQQIDQDYLVALSLQQEAPPADMAMSWPSSGQPAPHLSDHELALQLQEEENRRAAAAAPAGQQQQQQQQQQNPRQPAQRTQSAPVGGAAASQKKKDKDCTIL